MALHIITLWVGILLELDEICRICKNLREFVGFCCWLGENIFRIEIFLLLFVFYLILCIYSYFVRKTENFRKYWQCDHIWLNNLYKLLLMLRLMLSDCEALCVVYINYPLKGFLCWAVDGYRLFMEYRALGIFLEKFVRLLSK